MSARLSLIALLFLTSGGLAPASEDADAPEVELATYHLVFLVPDPDWAEEDGIHDRLAALRANRFKTAGDLYLRNLINDDVAVIAGPLPDHDRIQQVAILDVETPKDAEFVFQHSPAVEAGRLKLEIYTWTVQSGILKKPKDPHALRYVHLGMLRRPSDAPPYPREKLEELELAHRAHLRAMTESEDLVIDGPVENGGDLKEILIFRQRDAGRIEELVAEDPAVQAGRLKLELHRWQVPKRSWLSRSESSARLESSTD